jgi:glutamate-5-semialdehyde dehydrogenase
LQKTTIVQECDATAAQTKTECWLPKKQHMQTIEALITRTYKASASLRNATDQQIINTLKMLADAIEKNAPVILTANDKDVARQDATDPKTDRLRLNEERIAGIAAGVRKVSDLPNPTNKSLEHRTLYNGLLLEKTSVPLGVVGAIYESRPNVTYDIAALCIRSMNGCLLKGSSDAENSNLIAIELIKKALEANDIDSDCVNLLPAARETVQEMFTATKYIDVIIPRGSNSLIQYVRKNSLVPVIETGAGVCHIYIEKDADIEKAVNIVVNAKVTRPSVCNAVDTVLVDIKAALVFLQKLKPVFEEHAVEIFADPISYDLLKGYRWLQPATTEDFGREFLSLKCAIKVVENLDEALEHIQEYSTKHSEAIISENKAACEQFIKEVDAAVVYTNASTRFTDGEEFGLGAEIGISTQKLHARGPFALEKLVTEKWIVKGEGQVR